MISKLNTFAVYQFPVEIQLKIQNPLSEALTNQRLPPRL